MECRKTPKLRGSARTGAYCQTLKVMLTACQRLQRCKSILILGCDSARMPCHSCRLLHTRGTPAVNGSSHCLLMQYSASCTAPSSDSASLRQGLFLHALHLRSCDGSQKLQTKPSLVLTAHNCFDLLKLRLKLHKKVGSIRLATALFAP